MNYPRNMCTYSQDFYINRFSTFSAKGLVKPGKHPIHESYWKPIEINQRSKRFTNKIQKTESQLKQELKDDLMFKTGQIQKKEKESSNNGDDGKSEPELIYEREKTDSSPMRITDRDLDKYSIKESRGSIQSSVPGRHNRRSREPKKTVNYENRVDKTIMKIQY